MTTATRGRRRSIPVTGPSRRTCYIWAGSGSSASTASAGRTSGSTSGSTDFSGDRWTPIEERVIWGASVGRQTRDGQTFHEFAGSIRFGQGSLLRLHNGDILATHWCVIDGQGKVLAHRLRLA